MGRSAAWSDASTASRVESSEPADDSHPTTDSVSDGSTWLQLRRSDPPDTTAAAKSKALDDEACARRSLGASGFPWLDNHGHKQPTVRWAHFYESERKAAVRGTQARSKSVEAEPALGAEPSQPLSDGQIKAEPETEPEPEPDQGSETGLRSWKKSTALDNEIEACEAKKLSIADDEQAAAIAAKFGPILGSKTIEALLSPRSPRAGDATDCTQLGASPPPEETNVQPDAAKTAPAPATVMHGVRGDSDWFCAARLRESAQSDTWRKFLSEVPEQARGVQPIIEQWLEGKEAERKVLEEKRKAEQDAISDWLRELNLRDSEETLREYIGEDGSLGDMAELDEEDIKDLVQDLDLDATKAMELKEAFKKLRNDA